MKKFLAALGVVAAAVLLPVGAAHAYGSLSGPNTANVGATYNYTVSGLPTNDDVTLTVTGPAEVTFTPAAAQTKTPVAGAATFGVNFPAQGVYTFSAAQENNPVGTLTVTVGTAAVPDDGLPSTGADATPYLWFGGGLLVLGAALVTVLTVVRRNGNRTTA